MVAWRSLLHYDFVLGFLDAGIANDLHGTEDHRKCSDIASLWEECGMSKRREEIGAWVKERVDNGSLSSWLQYRDILPPYPDHDAQEEGEEAFEWFLDDEAVDDAPDGDYRRCTPCSACACGYRFCISCCSHSSLS